MDFLMNVTACYIPTNEMKVPRREGGHFEW